MGYKPAMGVEKAALTTAWSALKQGATTEASVPCPQISGRKCGFKSLSQLLEAGVKTRFVHQLLELHVQASLQTVV